jgi:hypothetical protein
MAITQITNHDELAKEKLAQQFKGKTNMENTLDVFSNEVQEVEDVFFQLFLERALNVAIGQQLDNLGTIIGLSRDDPDDELYRLSLQAEIGVNTSGATIEDIITMVDAALGDVTAIHLTECCPATFIIDVSSEPIDPGRAAKIPYKIQRARAAGVDSQFIWSESATNFTLSDVTQVVGGNGPISTTEGYADTAQTSGGPYTGVA